MPSMWWYKKTGENGIKVTKIYLFIVLSNIHLKLEFKIVIKIQFCSYFSVFVRHWFLISKSDSVSNLIPISRSKGDIIWTTAQPGTGLYLPVNDCAQLICKLLLFSVYCRKLTNALIPLCIFRKCREKWHPLSYQVVRKNTSRFLSLCTYVVPSVVEIWNNLITKMCWVTSFFFIFSFYWKVF